MFGTYSRDTFLLFAPNRPGKVSRTRSFSPVGDGGRDYWDTWDVFSGKERPSRRCFCPSPRARGSAARDFGSRRPRHHVLDPCRDAHNDGHGRRVIDRAGTSYTSYTLAHHPRTLKGRMPCRVRSEDRRARQTDLRFRPRRRDAPPPHNSLASKAAIGSVPRG